MVFAFAMKNKVFTLFNWRARILFGRKFRLTSFKIMILLSLLRGLTLIYYIVRLLIANYVKYVIRNKSAGTLWYVVINIVKSVWSKYSIVISVDKK